MNNYNSSPFEKLETLGKKALKPVKRAVDDAFTDALQSLTGNYPQDVEKNQPMPQGQQKNMARDDVRKMQQVRQNLVKINQEIVQARRSREQQYQQKDRVKQQVEERQVFEKKKKESVLQKLIKSRQGSKEAMQRASG